MSRIEAWVHAGARRVGRRVEEARLAYRRARSVPHEDGGIRIVCRRHAEQRVVEVDEAYRPACFDADHPACQGCVEDLRDGSIETW